jgi:hypothetical protein
MISAATHPPLCKLGVLTLDDEPRALAYLKLHERRWESEPKIIDGAEIYLDNLATTDLQTVGVLVKFKAADLVAYITEDEAPTQIRVSRTSICPIRSLV